VILDLGLPEVDGLTVLDRWRRESRKMPVLVLTARDSWSRTPLKCSSPASARSLDRT
jgi:DNA-binding response OmpR family regulator